MPSIKLKYVYLRGRIRPISPLPFWVGANIGLRLHHLNVIRFQYFFAFACRTSFTGDAFSSGNQQTIFLRK